MKKSYVVISLMLVLLLSLSASATLAQGPITEPVEGDTGSAVEEDTGSSDFEAVDEDAAAPVQEEEVVEEAPAEAVEEAADESEFEPVEAPSGPIGEPIEEEAATAVEEAGEDDFEAVESANELETAEVIDGTQDGPSSYNSGFQLQVLDGSTASVEMVFNNRITGQPTTASDTVDANKNYFPISYVDSGFDGSAVFSSDKPIAALVNVLGDDGAFGGGSYVSMSSGATELYFPAAYKNFFNINSFFYVQNTGSSAATVTANYSGVSGCSETATVQPGFAHKFDQFETDCLPDNHVNAATVTSDQPIVGTLAQYNSRNLLMNNGFTETSLDPVMPVIINAVFNTYTGVQIQNTGDTSTDVTVSYIPSGDGLPGQACTETQSVPAGESVTFGLDHLENNCGTAGAGADAGFVGGATVTDNSASQPLVVLVNQVDIPGVTKNGSAYSAIPKANATSTVQLPLIVKDLSIPTGNLFTGFNLLNTSDSEVTVNCTFSGVVNGTQSQIASLSGITIPPNGSPNFTQNGSLAPDGMGDGFVGSGTCTATGGNIVAVVNQAGGAGDALYTYEGIND